MNQEMLDEIRTWWAEIERLEREGKAVDLISFADAAHAFIPLLLKELDRWRQVGQIPAAQMLLSAEGLVSRPKPRDKKRAPLLSRQASLIALQMVLPLEGFGVPPAPPNPVPFHEGKGAPHSPLL